MVAFARWRLIFEFFLAFFDKLEILSCPQEAIGKTSNKLNICSSLDTREHDCIDSDESIGKLYIEIFTNDSCDVVN